MREDEIQAQISSEDYRVLERAIALAAQRAAFERQRADSAGSRAASILAPTGIVAGFLGYFATTVRNPAWDPLVVVTFLAAAIFLAKATVYAVRASWTIKGHELSPEFPLELQQLPFIPFLRKELLWRVWECEQLQHVSVRRLFMLNRAQRNFVAGLLSFIVLGTLDLIMNWVVRTVTEWLMVPLAVVVISTALLLDAITERSGNMWTRKDAIPTRTDSG